MAAGTGATGGHPQEGNLPPEPVPLAQWSLTNWLGVLLYLVLFVLAAWWIYRLARPTPGEGGGGSRDSGRDRSEGRAKEASGGPPTGTGS